MPHADFRRKYRQHRVPYGTMVVKHTKQQHRRPRMIRASCAPHDRGTGAGGWRPARRCPVPHVPPKRPAGCEPRHRPPSRTATPPLPPPLPLPCCHPAAITRLTTAGQTQLTICWPIFRPFDRRRPNRKTPCPSRRDSERGPAAMLRLTTLTSCWADSLAVCWPTLRQFGHGEPRLGKGSRCDDPHPPPARTRTGARRHVRHASARLAPNN